MARLFLYKIIHYLSSNHSKPFSQLMLKSENRLKLLLQPPDDNIILNTLKSTPFWEDFLEKSQHSIEANDLHSRWKQIEKYAHLSCKDILDIIQNEVCILESCYKIYINDPTYKEYRNDIKCKLEAIHCIKNALTAGILYRTNSYKILNLPPQTDDVIYVFCQEIDRLKCIETNLTPARHPSKTLTHDRRRQIFDLLKSQVSNRENDIINDILTPVPKRGILPFKSLINRTNLLNKQTEFTKEIFAVFQHKEAEPEKNTAFLSRFKKNRDRILKEVRIYIIKNLIGEKLAKFLYKYRYIAYTSVFWFLNQMLVFQLTLVFSLILPKYIIKYMSSGLMLTLGVAPLWYLGIKTLANYYNMFVETITASTRHYYLDSGIFLDHLSQKYNRLFSQPIIDIANYDLNKVINDCKLALDEIKKHKDQLSKNDKWKWIFLSSSIRTKGREIVDRLDELEVNLRKYPSELAHYISLRIGTEITQLIGSASSQNLTALINKNTILQLSKFVNAYGSQISQELFNESCDLTIKWRYAIKKFKTISPTTEMGNEQYPWGQETTNIAALKGWQTLIHSFGLNPEKRFAVMTLNTLMMGENILSRTHLIYLVKSLELGKHEKGLLRTIQNHLFSTLTPSLAKNAALLSVKQKKQISIWYNQNQTKISGAEHALESALASLNADTTTSKEISDTELSKYFYLLDGANIYYKTFPNTENKHFNYIRDILESYSGESSSAYRLLRYVPSNERDEAIYHIIKKRIHWIIRELSFNREPSNTIDNRDQLLFMRYQFMHTAENRSIFSIINSYPYWNQISIDLRILIMRNLHQSGLNIDIPDGISQLNQTEQQSFVPQFQSESDVVHKVNENPQHDFSTILIHGLDR